MSSQIRLRYHGARYELRDENPSGVMRGVSYVELDGEPVAGAAIALSDDGATHHVRIVLG